MVLRIKVMQEDFSHATSIDGWVDGLIQGRRGLWVSYLFFSIVENTKFVIAL
ncbi:hypothetical protein QHH11_25355 [Aphanizomenon sp. PH219]|nr:hypothetical protein [Aphanizomenon sp. PH219]